MNSLASSAVARSEPVRRPQVDQAESIDYQVSLGHGRPVQMFAPFRAAMRLAIAAQTEIVVLSHIRKLPLANASPSAR